MDSFWFSAGLNSLIVVVSVVIISLLISVPVAWLVTRTNIPGAKALNSAFALPYIIPSYLLAMAWILLANPSVGWINRAIEHAFGFSQLLNIYGLPGIIFIESSALFSILFLSLQAAMKKMDPVLEESARLSGAGNLRILLLITLPILKNSLLLGMISVGLASLASFGVPAMIGTPGRTFVVTTGIYSLFQNGTTESFQQAITLSLRIVLAIVIVVAISKNLSSKRNLYLGAKYSAYSKIDLRKWRLPLGCLLWLTFGLLFIIPSLALLIASFQSDPSSFSLATLTLNHWRNVLFSEEFIRSAQNSLVSSFSTAALVVVFCLLHSISKWHLQMAPSKWRNVLTKLFEEAGFVFYSLPGTVLALLLILFFRWANLASLSDSIGALIIAFVLKYVSLGVSSIGPSAQLVHPSLIEAAQLSGATTWTRLTRIWIPLLKPSLIAAFILVLMPCLGELTLSKLMTSPTSQNLGVYIFELQEYADRSSAAVVAVLLIATVISLNFWIGKINHDS